MKKISSVNFYFDAISPYAWLAWRPLTALAKKHGVVVKPIPVLFAGLLNSNGQLGPAEIPNKRKWLFGDVARRAHQQGLSVKPPPTHPFNPLISLRAVSLVEDNAKRIEVVGNLLDSVWMKERNVSDPAVLEKVFSECGLNGQEYVKNASQDKAKDLLKESTALAVSKGVFGVPTTEVNNELFWGSETDTMIHIEDATLGRNKVDEALIAQWVNIQSSAQRKRK